MAAQPLPVNIRGHNCQIYGDENGPKLLLLFFHMQQGRQKRRMDAAKKNFASQLYACPYFVLSWNISFPLLLFRERKVALLFSKLISTNVKWHDGLFPLVSRDPTDFHLRCRQFLEQYSLLAREKIDQVLSQSS